MKNKIKKAIVSLSINNCMDIGFSQNNLFFDKKKTKKNMFLAKIQEMTNTKKNFLL